jgi:glutathione S-transferase
MTDINKKPFYRLYYAPGAASLVVHWLLIETNAQHELVSVDIAAGEHKKPEFLAMNPNGLIPTMLINQKPHYEAAALALHLGDAFPEAGLSFAFSDTERRVELYQWMLNLANVVQPILRAWWNPHEPAGEAHRDAVRTQCQERLSREWTRIDQHLAEHGALLGRITVADFMLVMLMRWSRNMPQPATNWPNLAALAARLKQRPSFAKLYEIEGLTEWT